MSLESIDSITVCTPRMVRSYLERCIHAQVVPFITSSPGLGKSSIVRQLAEHYNLKLIDHRLSTSAPEDLSGLPRFTANGRAEFAPFADLFPLEGDELPEGYDGWLLFLDEFNSAFKSVQAAAYKLVLDRMTGQKKLHERVVVICAGNKATDRAITNTLSTAMQSRLVHIEMEASYDEWLEDVAIPNKWDERVIAYLSANKPKLMDFDPEHNEKTFCCPRTWEFVHKLLAGTSGPIPSSDTTLLGGTITKGVATSFVQFTAVYKEMVSLREIINDPAGCRLPSKPDLYWAVVTSLSTQVTKENYVEIFKYVARMDMTYRILFYRTVKQVMEDITDTDEWRNASIVLGKYLYSDK